MIKKQTVIVLGAGASVHLGFPLGQELIKDIYRLVFDKAIGVRRILDAAGERFSERGFLSNSQLLERFLELSDYRKEKGEKYTSGDIEEFADRLFQAQPPSIDFFLEKNPQYRLIGKLCRIKGTVLFILGETRGRFYSFDRNKGDGSIYSRKNWGPFLWFLAEAGWRLE